MYVYTYIFIFIYLHSYMIFKYVKIHVCEYIYICLYKYTHMYIYEHIFLLLHMFIYISRSHTYKYTIFMNTYAYWHFRHTHVLLSRRQVSSYLLSIHIYMCIYSFICIDEYTWVPEQNVKYMEKTYTRTYINTWTHTSKNVDSDPLKTYRWWRRRKRR